MPILRGGGCFRKKDKIFVNATAPLEYTGGTKSTFALKCIFLGLYINIKKCLRIIGTL